MNRAERKARTRERLLEAAQASFLEVGFEANTLARVGKKAGVAVGTVCLHFPSKGDLVAHAFHDVVQHHIDEGAANASEAPIEGLLDRVEPLFEFYAAHRELALALLRESLFRSDPNEEIFLEQIASFQGACAQHLQLAIARGALRPCDPGLAAAGFFADYFYVLMGMLSGGDPQATPTSCRAMLRALTALRLES